MATRKQARRGRRAISRMAQAGQWLYSVRRRIATVAAAVLAIMLGFHVVLGQNGITAFHNKKHNLQELQSEAQELQRENVHMQGHVDRLTNDPNAIEHQAREDLHYTRPGEVIVTLPHEPPAK